MLFISFIKYSNLQKRGIRIHSSSNAYQFYYNVKLIQTILKHLVTARDRGGLWKVNESVRTIFLECEKIFRSSTSQFQPVLKCSDLVQKMQTNSIVLSNFNSLCYDIEPRVNE